MAAIAQRPVPARHPVHVVHTQGDLIVNPTGPPTEWTFANFAKAWTEAGMATLMVNSVIVSGGVVLGTVILSSLGGFALGRLRLRGTAILPLLLTIGLVLPFEVLMIPLFYSFRAVGLLDSYLSMILPQVALGLPFGILLVRSFIAELPQDFFDAAEIDGAGLWNQYFTRLPSPAQRRGAGGAGHLG
jgi:ABC-type glycerol-3-phosphate transport system permease component